MARALAAQADEAHVDSFAGRGRAIAAQSGGWNEHGRGQDRGRGGAGLFQKNDVERWERDR